ncbi:hypothetical protein [Peterkaempfera sp. SMS 1(5)a]|uniref:hypothetical protein n=1 Tax=Peterkaempfera podocarpi TaxID=3232308 RepID=UPI00366F050B
MSRIRALTALAVLAAFAVAGVGTAQAAGSSHTGRSSNGSVVVSTGSGNLVGRVHGNANGSQQTATGTRGSSQNNTSAAAGHSGKLTALQGNGNLDDFFYNPAAPR